MRPRHSVHGSSSFSKKQMYVPVCACVLSRFGCVRLCHPMDRSTPGFSVHGVL